MVRRERQPPANVTDVTLAHWATGDDARWHTEPLSTPGLVNVRLEDALPARDFSAYPKQRHYEGSWWSSGPPSGRGASGRVHP